MLKNRDRALVTVFGETKLPLSISSARAPSTRRVFNADPQLTALVASVSNTIELRSIAGRRCVQGAFIWHSETDISRVHQRNHLECRTFYKKLRLRLQFPRECSFRTVKPIFLNLNLLNCVYGRRYLSKETGNSLNTTNMRKVKISSGKFL